MRFNPVALSAALSLTTGVTAFTGSSSRAFVSSNLKYNRCTPAVKSSSVGATTASCPPGCPCCRTSSSNTGLRLAGCRCPKCQGSSTTLFSSTADEVVEAAAADDNDGGGAEEVPDDVEAMDGIESSEEAHNADRPARKSLKKKGPRGKPLSEFSEGDEIKAKVKTVTSYGAFMDIGASTDGLLHISQLSVEFVSDVSEVLSVGQEVDVRIIKIDEGKNQVALTLLTAEQEETAKQAQQRPGQRGGGGGQRRDDGAVLSQLMEKGWNPEQFVEGTVVTTVDFGAFVRVDASQLAEGVEGTMDGLVHISALTSGRVDSVTSVVNVDDKVQVRVKAIADRKVSLTMVTPEDEAANSMNRGGGGGGGGFAQQGAKDWKESLERISGETANFNNRPLVVDVRK